jgi:hypothetical protein
VSSSSNGIFWVRFAVILFFACSRSNFLGFTTLLSGLALSARDASSDSPFVLPVDDKFSFIDAYASCAIYVCLLAHL